MITSKSWLHSKSFLLLMSAIAGALLPFAFAPHHIWPLAFISPAMLLWVWQHPLMNASLAALTGLIYGLGMFGVGVTWVFISVHHYGNTEIPLAVFITGLFVFCLALFLAAQGYVFKRFFRGNTFSFCLLGFPSSWVIFEWIRSWLFTGFPWLFLGYTTLDTPLEGYAPILSVYGSSFAVALTSGAIVALPTLRYAPQAVQKQRLIITLVTLLALWGVGQLLRLPNFVQAKNQKTTSVALVQGNIDPSHKFPGTNEIQATEESYGALTEPYWGADLVIWPESAIPLPLPYAKEYVQELAERAKAKHTTLITGVQIVNDKEEYTNSMIAVGDGKGVYHKYHLLPFGDFLPFDKWIRGLVNFFNIPMSFFTAGPANQELLQANGLKLNPLICYEIVFPEQVRSTLRDADAIINLSEDGWFGASWGPHQHLEIAQMRALETGRYVLRATPSGITAIIDPKGKLFATAPQFQATVLMGNFQSMTGKTPWVMMGLWPFVIFWFLCFILPGRVNRKWK